MNLFNIRNAFNMKDEKDWSEIYLLVDLHGTIIPSGKDSNDTEDNMEFYPGAKEVLQWFSNRNDVFIILWTSTPPERQTVVHEWLLKNKITVNFWNENPHAKNTPRSDFSKKPYFNILLDDRAGFCPQDGDWLLIASEIQKLTGEKLLHWTIENQDLAMDGARKFAEKLHYLVRFD